MTKWLIAIGLVIGSFSSANAAEHEGACKADHEKLCPGLTPGKGLYRCMKKNEGQVSPECKSQMNERKEHRKEAHEACKADVEKFCKDVKMGHGRIIECLKEHEAELSSECKAMEPKKR